MSASVTIVNDISKRVEVCSYNERDNLHWIPYERYSVNPNNDVRVHAARDPRLQVDLRLEGGNWSEYMFLEDGSTHYVSDLLPELREEKKRRRQQQARQQREQAEQQHREQHTNDAQRITTATQQREALGETLRLRAAQRGETVDQVLRARAQVIGGSAVQETEEAAQLRHDEAALAHSREQRLANLQRLAAELDNRALQQTTSSIPAAQDLASILDAHQAALGVLESEVANYTEAEMQRIARDAQLREVNRQERSLVQQQVHY